MSAKFAAKFGWPGKAGLCDGRAVVQWRELRGQSARLKRLLAESELKRMPAVGRQGKVLSPDHRRTTRQRTRGALAVAGVLPKVLRMDNGPELVSQALQRFCGNKAGLVNFPPGSPWGNGYIESFNNRLRKECLNPKHWNTHTLFEARVIITDFKHQHHNRRRHSALGYRSPAQYAAACRHTHAPVACEID